MPDTPLEHLRLAVVAQRETAKTQRTILKDLELAVENARLAVAEQTNKFQAQLKVLQDLETTYTRLGGKLDELGEAPPELRSPLPQSPPGPDGEKKKRADWTKPLVVERQSVIMSAWHAARKKGLPLTPEAKAKALAKAGLAPPPPKKRHG